jgi:hypothetical protein
MKSDTSTERVKEWRRKRNVSRNNFETEHDTNTIQDKIEPLLDSSLILKDSTKPKQLTKSKDLVRAAWSKFWEEWPHKVGKPAAERAFAKAFAKHDLEPIMAGLERYVRDKPPDRDWLNPATFLNQERFLDEPAPQSSTSSQRASGDGMTVVLQKLREQVNGQSYNGIKDITEAGVPDSGASNASTRVPESPGKPSGGGQILDFRPIGPDIRGSTAPNGEAARTFEGPSALWEYS